MQENLILIAAATEMELELLEETVPHLPNHGVKFLVTGIGMANMAFAMGEFTARYPVSLAINIGVAGAYDEGVEMVEVVQVVEDTFSEMGAGAPEGFLKMRNMGIASWQSAWNGKTYYNTLPATLEFESGLKQVRGISVNCVNGRQELIQQAEERWAPQVETMEGAAFFLACHRAGIPGLQFRGISNRVEPRNLNNWKMHEAADAVQTWLLQNILREETLHAMMPQSVS